MVGEVVEWRSDWDWGGMNLYFYCSNNSITKTDIWGNEEDPIYNSNPLNFGSFTEYGDANPEYEEGVLLGYWDEAYFIEPAKAKEEAAQRIRALEERLSYMQLKQDSPLTTQKCYAGDPPEESKVVTGEYKGPQLGQDDGTGLTEAEAEKIQETLPYRRKAARQGPINAYSLIIGGTVIFRVSSAFAWPLTLLEISQAKNHEEVGLAILGSSSKAKVQSGGLTLKPFRQPIVRASTTGVGFGSYRRYNGHHVHQSASYSRAPGTPNPNHNDAISVDLSGLPSSPLTEHGAATLTQRSFNRALLGQEVDVTIGGVSIRSTGDGTLATTRGSFTSPTTEDIKAYYSLRSAGWSITAAEAAVKASGAQLELTRTMPFRVPTR